MTDPGDELQASHPLRDAKVVVEDIEDNPGFFRVKLYAIRTSRSKAWTSTCRWFPRCRKRNRKARGNQG
jgi:predicted component of type VI protein secretion system